MILDVRETHKTTKNNIYYSKMVMGKQNKCDRHQSYSTIGTSSSEKDEEGG